MTRTAPRITLRDGTTTTDRRLDALAIFDPRSRDYDAMQLKQANREAEPRTQSWVFRGLVTDQGTDGAAAAHAVAHCIGMRPKPMKWVREIDPRTDVPFALYLHDEAQKRDGLEEGDNAGDVSDVSDGGASLLHTVKAAQARGFFDEYHWCFSAEAIARVVMWCGDVVVSTPWHANMYVPDRGFIEATGGVVGRHCYVISGIDPKGDIATGDHEYLVRNSFGKNWGTRGCARMTRTTLEALLADRGEAVHMRGWHVEMEAPW